MFEQNKYIQFHSGVSGDSNGTAKPPPNAIKCKARAIDDGLAIVNSCGIGGCQGALGVINLAENKK